LETEKRYATIDQKEFPLIKVNFTGARGTKENFQQYLNDLESCYEEKKPLAIIFDASQARIPKLSFQEKQALWISKHWKMIQTYCLGTAYIIPSFSIRVVLKIIFAFQNQPSPYKVFSKEEEATAWANTLIIKQQGGDPDQV